MARSPQATQRSGTGVGIDYERSAKVPELQTSAWARRVYPLQLAGTKPAIAAANVWTIKTYGPDRVAGFSPIPAMSMVSYAAGTRYLSLLGGTCLSFYDWYCDLPPASPMTWGEQTDVPESADWYNSSYIIARGLTYRRHVRRTPTSLPKYATKALKPSPLPLTTLKWPNCATSGWHRNKALIAPRRWQWAM